MRWSCSSFLGGGAAGTEASEDVELLGCKLLSVPLALLWMLPRPGRTALLGRRATGLEDGESATRALQSDTETGVRAALGEDDEAAEGVAGPGTVCGLLELVAGRRARLAGRLRGQHQQTHTQIEYGGQVENAHNSETAVALPLPEPYVRLTRVSCFPSLTLRGVNRAARVSQQSRNQSWEADEHTQKHLSAAY